MSGLTDMEEQLGSISNRDTVAFMREALACYGAGAYRGCIVLSYIALFDDIRLKLAELAKVNGVAKTLSQEVEKRSADQEVFESYMADQLQKTGLITQADHKQLNIVRDIRNRAAHPSGVHATAEEARYVYHAVISAFLGQPLLKTTHAVDAVMDRLTKTNLFPTTRLDDLKAIAATEIATMNPAAFPMLVARLIGARDDADDDLVTNARLMLTGLTALRRPELTKIVRAVLVEGKSHDDDFAAWVRAVVTADGDLVKGLKPDAVLRLRTIFEAKAKATPIPAASSVRHPARLLAAIITALGEAEALKDYKDFIGEVTSRFPYNPALLDALADSPAIQAQVVAQWSKNARSSTFETANAFADALPVIDDYADDFLTGAGALDLVAGVVAAAEWGARRSKSVRAQHFSDAPKIAASAAKHAKAKPKASLKTIQARVSGVASTETFLEDELGIE